MRVSCYIFSLLLFHEYSYACILLTSILGTMLAMFSCNIMRFCFIPFAWEKLFVWKTFISSEKYTTVQNAHPSILLLPKVSTVFLCYQRGYWYLCFIYVIEI